MANVTEIKSFDTAVTTIATAGVDNGGKPITPAQMAAQILKKNFKRKEKSKHYDEIKELVRKSVIDLIDELDDWDEKSQTIMKVGFDTACWVFKPPHTFMIGDGLFEDEHGDRFCRKDYNRLKYVKNHIVHEQGHGQVTERDRKKTNDMLKRIKAPFPLYNIFEDARMEEWMRKKHAYKFEWLTMEVMGVQRKKGSKSATVLLFSFIQAEGNKEVVRKGCEGIPEYEKIFEKVWDYYSRIIACPSSLALEPILAQWMKEFPPSKEESAAGDSDLQLGALLEENPELLEELIKQAKAMMGEGGEPDKDERPLTGEPNEDASIASSSGNLLTKDCQTLDNARIANLVAKFVKPFRPKVERKATSNPTKKFSMKNVMKGLPPFIAQTVKGRGPRKICYMVDCSGSMGGAIDTPFGPSTHINEGVQILAALASLARKGFVQGYVILSKVMAGKAVWQILDIKMSDSQIIKINADGGGEGLDFALRSNIKHLLEVDDVLVYTDGNITDVSIDKEYFLQRGIRTWGLYVGREDFAADKLNKYFERMCIRDTAEELIDAIITQMH